MTAPVEIATARFLLRPLTEHDVTERYLGWLRDAESRKFIIAAARTEGLLDLEQYVRDRSGRDDIFFLGIFEKTNGLHIGNIKYEPVNSVLGYAIMGILIGEPDWRGKGVAAEVLAATAKWLHQHRNIREIALGVDRTNIAAIGAYSKVGFVEESTDFIPDVLPQHMAMVWHLDP